MFVVMASGKCELHTYFNFLQRILTSTQTTEFNILFAEYVSRCRTFNFQLSKITKWNDKHIITKVFFKITIMKRHGYNDIGWDWIWNQCFYLVIWNDDRNKILVLPSLQLATRFNSQKTNETGFINELWHINMFMIISISNWQNWISTSRKCCFGICFSYLHEYWLPSNWNSLVHTSWGEM